MGLLEKMMGPRILNRHLTAKLTSNSNSLCMGPNQKLKQIWSISTNFLTKQLGPIPEISLGLNLGPPFLGAILDPVAFI